MVAKIRVLVLITFVCFDIFGTQVDNVSGN